MLARCWLAKQAAAATGGWAHLKVGLEARTTASMAVSMDLNVSVLGLKQL
jgi:hypothetical protein